MRTMRLLEVGVSLLVILLCATSTAAQVPDPQQVELYRDFWLAPEGSEEEKVALKALEDSLQGTGLDLESEGTNLHRSMVEAQYGSELVDLYRAFWDAPSGSDEEQRAREVFEGGAQRQGFDPDEAEQAIGPLMMSESLGELVPGLDALLGGEGDKSGLVGEFLAAGADEIGPTVLLPAVDVDIELQVPERGIVAGELWSVTAIVRNRGDSMIWISRRFCTLSLRPELYGQHSQVGSIPAFFPTVSQRASDEIVRIAPESRYSVVWKIDPLALARGEAPEPARSFLAKVQRLLERVFNSWIGFLFFVPGEYDMTANLHIWPVEPQLEAGFIKNQGFSATKIARADVEVDSSPWVLISGAVMGGLLAFLLQTLRALSEIRPLGSMAGIRRRPVVALVLGLASASLLTSVVTILLSRLSSADFLINVEVRDVWGAVATGLVVQWLGFGYLAQLIPREVGDPHSDQVGPDQAEASGPGSGFVDSSAAEDSKPEAESGPQVLLSEPENELEQGSQ